MNLPAVQFLVDFLSTPPDKPRPRPKSAFDCLTVWMICRVAAGDQEAYAAILLVWCLYHRSREKEVSNGQS
jgi:hypothetical protein